jgi:hypothetical protein
MSKKFRSTTEEIDKQYAAQFQKEEIDKQYAAQFQKEEIDKQYAAQFNALFVLVASLPDSKTQDILYSSLYSDDCSLKRKKDNEEE